MASLWCQSPTHGHGASFMPAVILLVITMQQPLQVSAKGCTPTGTHNCNETGCCQEEGMKCYQKNKEWATCRAECKPGPHYNEPPYSKDKWTCIELSWGCNKAFRQCGGVGFSGPHCCEYGCGCNASNPSFHQCLPLNENVDYCNKPYPSTTREPTPVTTGMSLDEAEKEVEEQEKVLAGALDEEDDDLDIEDLELDPIAQAIESNKFDMTHGKINGAPSDNGFLHTAEAAAPQILAALSIVTAITSVAYALSIRSRSHERRALPLISAQIAMDEEQASAENTRAE